jgi:hypothetical protein
LDCCHVCKMWAFHDAFQVGTLHSLNCASWYIYMRKTNKMYLYLINLFQQNYPLCVPSKQVHDKQVISVHAIDGISKSIRVSG